METRELAFRDIETIIKTLSDQAALKRARRLRKRSGVDQLHSLKAGFLELAKEKAKGSFDGFKTWAESAGQGIVLTAHPTFSLTKPVYDLLGEIAGQPEGEYEALSEKLKTLPFLREHPPTLLDEHEQAQSALSRIQRGLDELNAAILAVAKDSYPEEWHTLTPCLVKVYCWVGYDIDGRTDIGWGDALRLRLEEKQRQLSHYHSEVQKIIQDGKFEPDGQTALSELSVLLEHAQQSTVHDLELFEKDMGDTSNLVAAANHLTRKSKRRLRSTNRLYPLIETALTHTQSEADKTRILLLRAKLRCFGLGTARIHFRVNSRHVTSGIQSVFGINAEHTADKRMLAKRMAKQIEGEQSVSVNFASLALEKNTAHRQMILIAQIHKYIDNETPIRMLIAECEDSIIPLGMLYLARHYGLEKHIDISPLLETANALNNAGRIMDKLLSYDIYKEYVRKRGVFAVQTGFSDAGRFMGQLPATLAIERLQSHMATVLADHNMDDTTAVIFNTHGESMGRGGHPGSLQERAAYVMSPWAMLQFESRGLSFCHETSFQGGDGFLWFQTQDLTDASLHQLVLSRYADHSDAKEDIFYVDQDFSWDIFRTLSSEQDRLYNHPTYATILGGFSQNLLTPTGSRGVKRPDDKSATQTMDPRQLRAIPHNAILQQYAVPANTFFGLGRAAQIDAERFEALYAQSDRARRVIDLALTSKKRSDIYILTAYGRLFDPGFWLGRALSPAEPFLEDKCKAIAQILMRNTLRTEIVDLANMLRLDHLQNHQDFVEHDFEDGDIRRILSALRIALIMKMYILAADLPSFASVGSGKFDVLQRLQNLDISSITADLKAEYPAVWADMSWTEHLTEKNDTPETQGQGYPHLVEFVIKPLERASQITQQITIAMTHHYDAFG